MLKCLKESRNAAAAIAALTHYIGGLRNAENTELVYPIRKKASPCGRGKKYIARIRFKTPLKLSNGVYTHPFCAQDEKPAFNNVWLQQKTA